MSGWGCKYTAHDRPHLRLVGRRLDGGAVGAALAVAHGVVAREDGLAEGRRAGGLGRVREGQEADFGCRGRENRRVADEEGGGLNLNAVVREGFVRELRHGELAVGGRG